MEGGPLPLLTPVCLFNSLRGTKGSPGFLGTTLIGGPTAAVETFYSNIQGSRQMADDMDGYWSIRK
jgi:hypothetical protein